MIRKKIRDKLTAAELVELVSDVAVETLRQMSRETGVCVVGFEGATKIIAKTVLECCGEDKVGGWAMDNNIVDLKQRFGDKYRVDVDPSYYAETGSTTRSNRDPWLWILKGARGHVCPWGGDLLAVCIDGCRKLCKRLSREPWVLKQQYGDDGINAVFHVDDFEKAAVYAKLYRKRALTEEQRQVAADRLRENLDRFARLGPRIDAGGLGG